MLKLSVEAIALGVLTILLLPSLPESPTAQAGEASITRKEKHETYFEAVRSCVPTLLIFGVPSVLFWSIFRSRPPEDFRTSPLNKIYEDVFILTTFAFWHVAYGALREIALLPALRRLFPGKA